MSKRMSRPLHEVERVLSRVGFPRARRLSGPWTPTSDFVETDDAYIITAELPGVSDTDVDISVDSGVLTLSGSRRQEFTVDEDSYQQRERSFGSFSRRFPLPPGVAEDRITAGVAYGVLKVTPPKANDDNGGPRTIPVSEPAAG